MESKRNKKLLEKARKRDADAAKEDFRDKVAQAEYDSYRRFGVEFVPRKLGESSDTTEEDTSSSAQYKKGGSVKAKPHRGDGIAQRGKTRGRMI